MNSTSSTHRGTPSANGHATLPTCTCPACASPITREQYDKILRITEARDRRLAEEQAAVKREREELSRDRTKLIEAAVAQERARAAAQVSLAKKAAEREVERLVKKEQAERERLEGAFKKTLEAEVRKREHQEKALPRERARMAAKAKADADARLREAKREIEDKQGRVIEGLRDQLRTVEERRRREEDGLKKTIAELQHKAEARDRAHFGPEGEEALVRVLRDTCPGDRIEHHGKNGDVVHVVLDAGCEAATIVYEVKKTKTWQKQYLRQIKAAMDAHGTKHGVIVTAALPSRKAGLCVMGGVIVVEPALAAHVVTILREGILAISRLRASEKGKEAKMVALFNFLRGEEFAAAVQRAQEKLTELNEDLSREQSHHQTWWRRRQQHYAAILREVTGLDARVRDILREPVPRAKPLASRGRTGTDG